MKWLRAALTSPPAALSSEQSNGNQTPMVTETTTNLEEHVTQKEEISQQLNHL